MNDFNIRHALPEDIQKVSELEALIFSDPWSYRTICDFYEACLAKDKEVFDNLFYIAEGSDKKIAAYCLAQRVMDEGSIMNIATSPEMRRKGAGEALLKYVMEKLLEGGMESTFLEVRKSNLGARALYEKIGFEFVTIREGYYRDPTEDAVIMRYTK